MVCLYNKVCDEIFLCISAYSAQKPYDLSMGWVELDVPVQGKDYDLILRICDKEYVWFFMCLW